MYLDWWQIFIAVLAIYFLGGLSYKTFVKEE